MVIHGIQWRIEGIIYVEWLDYSQELWNYTSFNEYQRIH
jgi:hypothetical protein